MSTGEKHTRQVLETLHCCNIELYTPQAANSILLGEEEGSKS